MPTCALRLFDDGDHLIRALRRRNFLDRPFGLFIIALTTQIDEAALVRLQKYAEAIDSLTGPTVAFVLFFNATKFDFGEEAPPDIQEYIQRRSDEFSRSMTYESDKVARSLGVHPSELPCIVLIDDPQSLEFYVQRMSSDDDFLFRLRTLVGDFYATPNCRAYSEELNKWIDARRRLGIAKRQNGDVESVTQQLEGITSVLTNMTRPSVGPILKKMKWAEKRTWVKNAMFSAEQFAQENAESALKAVEFGLKLSGSPG